MNPKEYHVSNAGGSCIGADVAAAKSFAAKHAAKLPTGNGGGKNKRNKTGALRSIETQHDTHNGRFYIPTGFTRLCDSCGREYVAKRDTSRFCSSRCRVAAHRASKGQGGEK